MISGSMVLKLVKLDTTSGTPVLRFKADGSEVPVEEHIKAGKMCKYFNINGDLISRSVLKQLLLTGQVADFNYAAKVEQPTSQQDLAIAAMINRGGTQAMVSTHFKISPSRAYQTIVRLRAEGLITKLTAKAEKLAKAERALLRQERYQRLLKHNWHAFVNDPSKDAHSVKLMSGVVNKTGPWQDYPEMGLMELSCAEGEVMRQLRSMELEGEASPFSWYEMDEEECAWWDERLPKLKAQWEQFTW